MERKHALELLDNDSLDATELSGNLRDLARLNRWTGNTAAVLRAVDKLIPPHHGGTLSIVDIGTGAGDLPAMLNMWAEDRQLRIYAYGGDLHPVVLDYARGHGKAAGWLQLEATHLPLATGSVDIAVCTTMAHHLEPAAVQCLLTEMARVSRRGFIVLDLERSRIAHIALSLLTRLISRNRLTRHDGPLSIARAYMRTEFSQIAASVGLTLVIVPVFPFRWMALYRPD